MFILLHKKQGRSKIKLLNLLKGSATDRSSYENNSAVTYNSCNVISRCNRKDSLQLLHRIPRTGDLEPPNIKSLFLNAETTLISLPFAALQWSRCHSFQGLMGLCNEKKYKVKKTQWFIHLQDNKRFFISFDVDLAYFSAKSFDILFSHEVLVRLVLCFTCSICLMKVKS